MTGEVTCPSWEDTVLLNGLWAYERAFYIFVVTHGLLLLLTLVLERSVLCSGGAFLQTHS